MRVLVACETSGAVRNAFRALGHDAWSCDLLPSDDGSKFHLQEDALLSMFYGHWDMLIAHPPCTHLAVSGAAHFADKRADGRQRDAINFFMALAVWRSADIPRVAIENPVCIMSTVWREPDQIIHPWSFGHPEQKTTCLWLKGLPPLIGTKNVYAEMMERPKKDRERIHYMSPGPDRWKERSKTFVGIAQAMAAQWGDYSDLVTQMEAHEAQAS